ncbi:MAG: hypothetical protein WBX25_11155 [Rhodomicrobium sp.]
MRISLQQTLRALACILALLVLSPQRCLATNAPKGIYAFVIIGEDLIKTAGNVANSSTDLALSNYFSWILNNDAVSGLLIGVPWSILNPNDPNPTTGPPPSVTESTSTSCPPTPSTKANLAAAYVWNTLDVALCAVIKANKTLQLSVTPGFDSPQWLYQPLILCDYGTGSTRTLCSPSLPVPGHLIPCDTLFLADVPVELTGGRYELNWATPKCGYTTIFVRTENTPHINLPLPLPWNADYLGQWQTFLTALNNHIKSNSALVSIGLAGPTASSGEMILPNTGNQKPPLTLPTTFPTSAKITATAAWNCLLANSYSLAPAYLNSDQAFIEAWKKTIDIYGTLFNGITLIVNTGNGLPIFHDPAPYPNNFPPGCAVTGIWLPAAKSVKPAFPPDCVATKKKPANMDCAAETVILSYFLTPSVATGHAKATAEDGLTARGQSSKTLNLSAASVKWLSSTAASKYLASGTVVLGGLQPAKPFSSAIAEEGCQYGACEGCQTKTSALCQCTGKGCTATTTVSASTCTAPSTTCSLQGLCTAGGTTGPACGAPKSGCPGGACMLQGWCKDSTGSSCTSIITPEDALYYVLQSYFAGTSAYPYTTANNTTAALVSNAPLNYLQIYDVDILYASGLAEHSFYPGLNKGDGCTIEKLMSAAPPTLPKGCKVAAPLPTSTINSMTAQAMLSQASTQIVAMAVTPK